MGEITFLDVIEVITIVVAVVIFFVGVRFQLSVMSNMLTDLTNAIGKVDENISKLNGSLEEIRRNATEEHQALMKAMTEDHKDFLEMAGKQNEILVKIEQNLQNHVMAEEISRRANK